jgi:putative toxin-antitoxin system antitoxin component (TIGR02293 family)
MRELASLSVDAASRRSTKGARGLFPGRSLGLRVSGTRDLIREIERGFSFRALKSFAAATGLAVSRIASILEIPERTLARRRTAGRLAPEESERLLRISRVFEKAVNLFEGDATAAVSWLTTPRRSLGDEVPLAYSRTELGAREVENLIGRLEHGVFS